MTTKNIIKIMDLIQKNEIQILERREHPSGKLFFFETLTMSILKPQRMYLFKVQDQIAGGFYCMGENEFHMATIPEFKNMGYMSRYLPKLIQWKKTIEESVYGESLGYIQACSVEIHNAPAVAVLQNTAKQIELTITYKHN